MKVIIEESRKGSTICSVYGGQEGKKRLTDEGIKFRKKISTLIQLTENHDVRVEMRKTKRGDCLKKVGEFANMYDAHVAVYNMRCPSHASYDPKAKKHWFAFTRVERNTLYPDQKSDLEDFDNPHLHYVSDMFKITMDNYSGPMSTIKITPDYKFNEGLLIDEFRKYVDSTYESHYSKEQFQATEFIIDGGHGTGFCIGNVLKYAQRYGKKGTDEDARKDLMKVLHYTLMQLYIHDSKKNT